MPVLKNLLSQRAHVLLTSPNVQIFSFFKDTEHAYPRSIHLHINTPQDVVQVSGIEETGGWWSRRTRCKIPPMSLIGRGRSCPRSFEHAGPVQRALHAERRPWCDWQITGCDALKPSFSLTRLHRAAGSISPKRGRTISRTILLRPCPSWPASAAALNSRFTRHLQSM